MGSVARPLGRNDTGHVQLVWLRQGVCLHALNRSKTGDRETIQHTFDADHALNYPNDLLPLRQIVYLAGQLDGAAMNRHIDRVVPQQSALTQVLGDRVGDLLIGGDLRRKAGTGVGSETSRLLSRHRGSQPGSGGGEQDTADKETTTSSHGKHPPDGVRIMTRKSYRGSRRGQIVAGQIRAEAAG